MRGLAQSGWHFEERTSIRNTLGVHRQQQMGGETLEEPPQSKTQAEFQYGPMAQDRLGNELEVWF